MDLELYFTRNLVIFLDIYSDVLCICKRKKAFVIVLITLSDIFKEKVALRSDKSEL